MRCFVHAVLELSCLFASVGRGGAIHLRLGDRSLAALDFDSATEAELEVAELAAHDAYIRSQWDGASPWKPAEQQADREGRNLCVEGKQVPDFYVLGVQKCATTTLAENLAGAGVKNVHGDKNPKEFHWLDHRMNFTVSGVEGHSINKAKWLEWMPSCPQSQGGVVRRSVLADFTPDYFRIVPRPEDFKLTGKWMKSQTRDVLAPRYLRQLYGAKNSKKLTFAIMFREPLAQMQSAWYHAASFNFTNACKSCRAPSFKVALESLVTGLRKKTPELTPWLWTTLYARQLKRWFEYFDASQFYVIPMHQISGPEKDGICTDLRKRLSFRAECDSHGAESLHSWSHEHPPVNEDAGPELRKAFDELMAKENSELVELLAAANAKGMGLANYAAAPGSEDGVRAWLHSSW